MKALKLLSILTILFLTACSGPVIDYAAIEQSKNEVFRIGTIKVPCDLQGIPSLDSYTVRVQKKMLRRIDHQEILKIMSDTYGLQFADKNDLEIDSYPMRLAGFFSDSIGRCTSYKNNADATNNNIIDIAYDLEANFPALKPITAKLSYKVQIKSGKKKLAQHTGEVETFKYERWLTLEDFDLIIDAAEKIPEALKRDIEVVKN